MSLMKDFSYFSFSRQVFPLNSCNMLVGGSTLKETTCAYAFAVYTGPQTKLGQNLKNKPNKFSTAEKTMNKLVLFLLGLLAILLIILTVLHYVVDDFWVQRETDPAGECPACAEIVRFFATKHLYNWLCPSVGLSVTSVTHSFDDQHVAPYWPTWPCFRVSQQEQPVSLSNGSS